MEGAVVDYQRCNFPIWLNTDASQVAMLPRSPKLPGKYHQRPNAQEPMRGAQKQKKPVSSSPHVHHDISSSPKPILSRVLDLESLLHPIARLGRTATGGVDPINLLYGTPIAPERLLLHARGGIGQ